MAASILSRASTVASRNNISYVWSPCSAVSAVAVRGYKVRVQGNLQRGNTMTAFRKIQDNFSRSKMDSKVHERFFVKPTRARRQNKEAAQWWLARKDVRGILQQGLRDGNLKLPPYVSL